MICFLAVSLFCTHACSSFNDMLTKLVDSTVEKASSKALEIKATFYFSKADFENAKIYAGQCIKSSSDSSKCSALLQSIKDYQINENAANNYIVLNSGLFKSHLFKKAALEHVKICQTIAKEFTTSASPLSLKTNILALQVMNM